MKHPQTVTVYPEKNENKAAYLLWRSLRAAVPSRCFWAASQGIISVRKSPCRRLSSFCGNFDGLIVKIDGFAKKVDEFLMI